MSEYRRKVWEWIVGLPSDYEFSANDVRNLFGEPDPEHEPNAGNNAIGKIFADAHGAGLIEKTGQDVRSNAPRRKGGTDKMWRRTAKRQEKLF